MLGLSYGAFVLGFGISFWQAAIAGLIGIVLSFLLCGFIAIAGKRGAAPTLILSRAAFGVRGNKLPSIVSWILCVASAVSTTRRGPVIRSPRERSISATWSMTSSAITSPVCHPRPQ